MAASDITLIGADLRSIVTAKPLSRKTESRLQKTGLAQRPSRAARGWMGSSRRSVYRFEGESAQIVATFTTSDNSVSNARIRGQLGPWMFDLKPARTLRQR
jgi:hypothetical protein